MTCPRTPRQGATMTLLTVAACACCAVWTAVDAAPLDRDSSEAVPCFQGRCHSPFCAFDRDEFQTLQWKEKDFFDLSDFLDPTNAGDSVEDGGEAAAGAGSGETPWNAYSDADPSSPFPVYRGSSVGTKAWYRGIAAKDRDDETAADNPTRLSFSLLDDLADAGQDRGTNDLAKDRDEDTAADNPTRLCSLLAVLADAGQDRGTNDLAKDLAGDFVGFAIPGGFFCVAREDLMPPPTLPEKPPLWPFQFSADLDEAMKQESESLDSGAGASVVGVPEDVIIEDVASPVPNPLDEDVSTGLLEDYAM